MKNNKIEIPKELVSVQEDVTLSIDGLNVNSLDFLTTISHDIYYRTAQYVQQRTAPIYEKCMEEVDAVYVDGGFQIKEIHCDNEFRTSMTSFARKHSRQITMNYTSAKEHVPRAERNNRTIQERIRATYHRLPYDHLPRIMVKYLVSEAARKLNFFPAKHGVSKHYSPRMILHQENLDYAKHGLYTFGEYVLGHNEPTPLNTQKARALDCIYLRPTSNMQEGHELYRLHTNSVITRRKCTPMPLTPSIIKQVHTLAAIDNMPKGIKIQNRTGITIFDSS